jgi:hypothetical protein
MKGDQGVGDSRSGSGSGEGLPGTGDEGGGGPNKMPVGKGQTSAVQGKDVNGGLAQAGDEDSGSQTMMEGHGGGDGKVENKGSNTPADLSSTTGAEKSASGGSKNLSPDDPPMGEMASGESGIKGKEENAGMQGGDIDVGSLDNDRPMKKGELDEYSAPVHFDLAAAREHALKIQKMKDMGREYVSFAPARTAQVLPFRKSDPDGTSYKSMGSVLISSASDDAVEAFQKSEEGRGDYYGGGSEPGMGNEAVIFKSAVCPSCNKANPAMLSKCGHCGGGMGGGSMEKSQGGQPAQLSVEQIRGPLASAPDEISLPFGLVKL